MMKKLLILGPNPAWQKVLRFPSLTLGEVCRAVELLDIRPDHALVDGNRDPEIPDVPSLLIIGGDGKSASIGAASILAKVARDRAMLIDASYGRKTKAVILMDTDHVILSAIPTENLYARWMDRPEPDTEEDTE